MSTSRALNITVLHITDVDIMQGVCVSRSDMGPAATRAAYCCRCRRHVSPAPKCIGLLCFLMRFLAGPSGQRLEANDARKGECGCSHLLRQPVHEVRARSNSVAVEPAA